MTDTPKEEITPDQLLDTFRGSSMKNIILFTVAVHVVVLLATSAPYLWKSIAGGDNSKLGEKDRMDLATREARNSLREIATKHGVKPEELSNRFAESAPAAAKVELEEHTAITPEEGTPVKPDAPESEIEKEINTKEAGPKLPPVQGQDEDLFK